ncbi:hypothetical protein ACIG3E_11395 [Streptomyces sp. NPDC053474]|uniref:hypothetical protein n=1 Tax=Streptomyces sp. NPDC053474 TaxID=3365704 RepID=UPI0037D40E5E
MTSPYYTASDGRRWQIHSVNALAALLKRADAAELPAINWTVVGLMEIRGAVDSLHSDPLGIFHLWAEHLDLEVKPPVRSLDTWRHAALGKAGDIRIHVYVDVYEEGAK